MLQNERLLSIRDAIQSLPRRRGTRSIHISTVYRWIHRGVGGRKLECLAVGGTLYTSKEAMHRFFARDPEPASPPKSDVGSSAAIQRAERELAEFGI